MNIWTSDSSEPPVSAAQIQAWEQAHRVRMPAVLRAAMMVHNGGTIIDSFEPDIEVKPLEDWEVVDEDDLELFDIEPGVLPYIAFADNEYGGNCVLNYSRCGPQGEPAVCTMYFDGMSMDEVGADVGSFVAGLSSRLTDAPTTHGGHATHLTRLGQTQIVGHENVQHCLVGRDCDGRLIQMDYCVGRDEESWSAIYLPEPLQRSRLVIAHERFYGTHGYGLDLAPQETDGIREWSSSKLPSGRWKNDLTDGVPVYSKLYSQDLEPLILLRQALAGPPQTHAQAEAEILRIEYLRRMVPCTPQQREAADFYITQVESQGAFENALDIDDDADEETAEILGGANDFLKQAMGRAGEMMARLQSSVTQMMGGPEAVPPEIRQLIDRMVAAEKAVEDEED